MDFNKSGISKHGVRQDGNGSEVSRLGEGHRLDACAGSDSHRANQLSQRSLPGARERPSQPAGPAEDGRPKTAAAELHEAYGRRRLPTARPGTRAPVLIE